MRIFLLGLMGLFTMAACAGQGSVVEVEPLLRTLRAVGPYGKGDQDAARAWRELARLGPIQLPTILAGMDGAGPLATNWICTAADAIAERPLQNGGVFPAAELERFVLDTRHATRARALAMNYLVRVHPEVRERLVAGMLDDPSVELRRDAVARLIGQAARLAASGKKDERAEAVLLYRRAFSFARDRDQVADCAQRLRELGQSADPARQLGYVVGWKLIGPFDNTSRRGFDTAYPPEAEIRFDVAYPGKLGVVSWRDFTSRDDWGTIDFQKLFGEHRDAVGYAASEFFANRAREAEFRTSSDNALKLWLNGRPIARYQVYHSGYEADQYVNRVTLQAGRNLILVKVCQNEQTQDWARHWDFQLRVVDEAGKALLSHLHPPREQRQHDEYDAHEPGNPHAGPKSVLQDGEHLLMPGCRVDQAHGNHQRHGVPEIGGVGGRNGEDVFHWGRCSY
ncbi:MAG: hypothetical protein ACLQNE_15160 [Thermoguttaceae bacterium]